jgi:hypothetical protein
MNNVLMGNFSLVGVIHVSLEMYPAKHAKIPLQTVNIEVPHFTSEIRLVLVELRPLVRPTSISKMTGLVQVVLRTVLHAIRTAAVLVQNILSRKAFNAHVYQDLRLNLQHVMKTALTELIQVKKPVMMGTQTLGMAAMRIEILNLSTHEKSGIITLIYVLKQSMITKDQQ